MEFLLSLLFLFSFSGDHTTTNVSAKATHSKQVALDQNQALGNGNIVMADIIALVDTENSSDHIASFTVYEGTTTMYSAGSHSGSTNSYDLGALPAGIYEAEVFTQNGNSFDEIIIIF